MASAHFLVSLFFSELESQNMSYTTEDAVNGIRRSRAGFLKHLNGLKDDQWTWKPYAECKSIVETLGHLICDDRAALQSLRTGKEPDYTNLQETETDRERLLKLLGESHAALCDHILSTWGSAPADTEVCIWGTQMPLAGGMSYLTSEDFYHAGQVAFIRGATDPTWDYYTDIYGSE
jgi:uncharacterized damage-inducible protein DinB